MKPSIVIAFSLLGYVSAFIPHLKPRRVRQWVSASHPTDQEMPVNNGTSAPPQRNDLRIVMKFGGSSLADADRIRYVAQLIADQRKNTAKSIMVVCSAMGKSTNSLINAGEYALSDGRLYMDSIRSSHLATCDSLDVSNNTRDEIKALLNELEKLLMGVSVLRELTPRTRDLLVSFGERMSVRLVASCLNSMGVPSEYFESWTLGMRTTSDFGNALVDESSYGPLRDKLSSFDPLMVPVITGFIGQDEAGSITTLGRGGSDLTAAVLGAACGLDEIQVWKDVDGMLTADPRIVPKARPVPSVTFEEASELAYFGAKILHPISMLPAMKSNIPVRVKNSYNPSHPGTLISAERCYLDTKHAADHDDGTLVTAITSKSNQMVLDVVSNRMLGQYGFLASVFKKFEEAKISVDMIATSEVSVSLTVDPSESDLSDNKFLNELREVAAVSVDHGNSILSLIANVQKSSNVLAAVFAILEQEGIQVKMISQGASKVNISVIVTDADLEKAIAALHRYFFE